MKVSDLEEVLQDACIERGLTPDDEITAVEAIEEWCGWHIGDPSWGAAITQLYDAAKQLEEAP